MGSRTWDSASWKLLVESARKDEANLGQLLDALCPALTAISHQIAPHFTEDAVQIGLVKVWQELDWVDVSLPERVIRAGLLKIAVHAIRDEVRRQRRQEYVCVDGVDAPIEDSNVELPLSYLMEHYIDHIRQHGCFNGAHRAVAKRVGLSLGETTQQFQEDAKHMAQELSFSRIPVTTEDILKELMSGTFVGSG